MTRNILRTLFDWIRRRRPGAFPAGRAFDARSLWRPSLDDRRVRRAIEDQVAREPAALEERGLAEVSLGASLDANVAAIRTLGGDAPDLVVRELEIAGGPRAAAVFWSCGRTCSFIRRSRTGSRWSTCTPTPSTTSSPTRQGST